MCHEIRKYMAIVDGNDPIGGFTKQVDIDETFIGGYKAGDHGSKHNTIVLGMMERGGNIMTGVVPNRRMNTLVPIIKGNVRLHFTVHTDELV